MQIIQPHILFSTILPIDFDVLIKLNWPKAFDVFINYANQKGKHH